MNSITAKVIKSNIELTGPKINMNFLMDLTFQGRGFSRYSLSTLSVGIATCERSYRKLFKRIWMGSMGKNGRNRLAPAMLNIFPKLELEPILMYLTILPKVL